LDVKTLKFGEMYPLGNPDTARLAPSADRARTATDALIDMAGIRPGMRVLDLACGAGSQTIQVAKRVGPNGGVVASDISALTMCAEAPARRGWITLRLLNARQTTWMRRSLRSMRLSADWV